MMKRTGLLIAAWAVCNTAFAYGRYGIYPSFGAVYQREMMADVSLIRMYDQFGPAPPGYKYAREGTGIYGTTGLRCGVETNFNSNHLILAPKIGAECSVLVFLLRGNLTDYWSAYNGEHDLRLTPEAGLTFGGTASLAFGCNIHVLGNRSGNISELKLSLLLNLNRLLIRTFIRNGRE